MLLDAVDLAVVVALWWLGWWEGVGVGGGGGGGVCLSEYGVSGSSLHTCCPITTLSNN